ncbi:MAG: T9SS type A sorting domain-containing protein [Bacteroidales bacterium]|nr:T9SS type A sorting domain-containing protein [Bacteroidales bacterium]
MKRTRTLLLAFALFFTTSLIAQEFAPAPKEYRNIAVPDMRAVDNPTNLKEAVNPFVKSGFTPSETQIGETKYDLQSNACTQNRTVFYDDGTAASTWIMGFEDATGFPGRGTGYNYYDGSEWGPYPTERIESTRNGWPSYDKWGENGEIVVTHSGGADGLVISNRPEKGTGDWTETFLPGPEGHEDILWPRMITAGENNEAIHILALTPPIANQGSPYEDLDGALLYYRSTDGGQTWEDEHRIIDGISSDYYAGFSGDTYAWIDSEGDDIAFLVGDNWVDFMLMQSHDGGETWEKTVIWEHPYPMWDPNNPTPTDTFYCVDGSFHGAYDANGKIHVTFGINRAMYEDGAAGPSWFPFVEGIGYWNEDRESFSDNVDALSPYTGSDPDSEMEYLHNLIGWVPDLNGNGTWVDDLVNPEIDGIGTYYLGPASMPQIVVDENNTISIVFSAVCEERATQNQNYRQLFATASPDGGTTWREDFAWLTESPVHTFDECVFPSVAATSTEDIHFSYQADEEPGLAVRGDEDAYTMNKIIFASVPKDDYVGVEETIIGGSAFNVSANYPNPVSGLTNVDVTLEKDANVNIAVYSMTGQRVMETSRALNAGTHKMTINAGELSSGVYFYTVTSGDKEMTRKMIVE